MVLIKAAQGFGVRRTHVRRSHKPAENADQGQKDPFATITSHVASVFTPDFIQRLGNLPQGAGFDRLHELRKDIVP